MGNHNMPRVLKGHADHLLKGLLGPSSALVVIWCCVEENNVAMYEGVASSLGHNGDQETVEMCLKAPLAHHHHASRSYFS